MGFGNPLSPAQLAAAIAGTTLTITGQVTTTPTNGGDEDTLRILDQAGIDALTSADKATPFVIWNSTTGKPNYVVNGAVQVPSTDYYASSYKAATNQNLPGAATALLATDITVPANGRVEVWIQAPISNDTGTAIAASFGVRASAAGLRIMSMGDLAYPGNGSTTWGAQTNLPSGWTEFGLGNFGGGGTLWYAELTGRLINTTSSPVTANFSLRGGQSGLTLTQGSEIRTRVA